MFKHIIQLNIPGKNLSHVINITYLFFLFQRGKIIIYIVYIIENCKRQNKKKV